MKKNAIILKKPSGMIAVQCEMSLDQRKFYNAFIYIAKKQLTENKDTRIFRCTLGEIKALLEKAEQNNAYYLNTILDLQERKAYFDILEKDIRVRGKMNVLSYVGIIERQSKKENIWIELEFPERIRQALIDPKGIYANINLIVEKGFKSKYTLILYELLKDYIKVEFPRVEIIKLKKMFGLEENKYKRFYDFRKKIDLAINELNNNENVDFVVTYKLYKTGKKYTHIKFFTKPKPAKLKEKQKIEQQAKNLTKQAEILPLLYLIPANLRRSKKIIGLLEAAIDKKDKEYIKAQIEYVNRAATKKNINNYYGYLKKAIEEDYASFEKEKTIKDEDIKLAKLLTDWIGFTFTDYTSRQELKVVGITKDKDKVKLNLLNNVGKLFNINFNNLEDIEYWLKNKKN